MKNSSLIEIKSNEEIQTCLLYLLKEFHTLCETNGLHYTLFGGTLLGAVRHKGFIPWDDDIDVGMMRKDYDRFVELMQNKISNEKYELFSYPKDGYIYPFAKFCLCDSVLTEMEYKDKYSKLKLYIDVFPIDGYPPIEKEKEHFDLIRQYKYKKGCIVCKSRKDNESISIKTVVRSIRALIYGFKGMQYYLQKEMKERAKYIIDDNDYVAMQGAGWNEKGKLETTKAKKLKLYDFEGEQFYGIEDYDSHLTRLYGDYMTLPPVEKRISNHNYSLFIGEKTYLTIFGGKK